MPLLRSFTFSLALFFGINAAAPIFAGFIQQPTAASASFPNILGTPARTINQSGLSTGYTSGSTDWTTYMGTSPLHNSLPAANVWYGSGSTGTITYDLGSPLSIESMALWGAGPEAINAFDLLISSDAGFATFTNVGSFDANNIGSEGARGAQAFNFTPTVGRYVRLSVNSVDFPGSVSVGEVAFNVNAIPEPSTLVLGVVGMLGLLWATKRKGQRQ